MKTPFVLPDNLRAKWPRLHAQGNPFVTFPTWKLDPAQDPAWIANRNLLQAYPAWLATGDVRFKNMLTEDRMFMPDVSAFEADGVTPIYVSHLFEVPHARDYLLVEEELPDGHKAEWQRRLKLRAEQAIGEIRIGDFDRCLNTLGYLRILDMYLQTEYKKITAVVDCVHWVDDVYMDVRTFKPGGGRDASSGYELSTFEIAALVAAICGIDIWPWFDEWAKEYSKFLLMSVSSDYHKGAAWGDQEQDDGMKLVKWHRIQLCFLLSGLGYDESGELISLGKKLIGEPQFNNPGSIYPYGSMGYELICDPERIMATPHIPLKDGILTTPRGTFIDRTQDTFAETNLMASILEDDFEVPQEDHDYEIAPRNYALYHKGKRIIAQRGGYGTFDVSLMSYNSCAFKGESKFWSRKKRSIEIITNGFIATLEQFGPHNTWHHQFGGVIQGSPDDYKDCRTLQMVEYDRTKLRFIITDKWFSPGNTFPVWATDLPCWQVSQHAIVPITRIDNKLLWAVDGFPMQAVFNLYDENMQAIQPTVFFDEGPEVNGVKDYRAFVQAPANLFNGTMILDISPQQNIEVQKMVTFNVLLPVSSYAGKLSFTNSSGETTVVQTAVGQDKIGPLKDVAGASIKLQFVYISEDGKASANPAMLDTVLPSAENSLPPDPESIRIEIVSVE